MTINPSEKLGNKYTLLNLIGMGGMAEVFRGKLSGAEGFEKLVVLKKLLSQYTQDTEIVSHFISEAKLAALLQHENIAQIYDFGELDGSYFIAMEYLYGKDLHSVMQRARELDDPMGVEQALFIVGKICEGMEYAHSLKDFKQQPLNIIHRDLSPHNIFITYEGRVKIIDFGIARAELFDNRTKAGVAKGKLSYMSPEQLTAERIDQRSDIFAIGILMYEMLSGKRMYSGDTATMIRKCMHVEYDKLQIVRPGLGAAIYEILDKALAKDVGQRYESCALMQADVEECLFNISKRPNTHLLEKYVGRLFAAELAAEKHGTSPFLTPPRGTNEQTVAMSTSLQAVDQGAPVAKESDTAAIPEPPVLRSTASPDGVSAGPAGRSRKAQLMLAGSICGVLVLLFLGIREFGRDQKSGLPDTPEVSRVVSRPAEEVQQPAVPPEPVLTPSPTPVQESAIVAPESPPVAASAAIPQPEPPDANQQLLNQAGEIVSKNRPEPRELEAAQRLYRQVLEKDPDNRDALVGLERISEHYRAATEEALKSSNFSQATKTKAMFQAPKDKGFSSLQESMGGGRQKTLAKLLEKADEAMRNNHLTTPMDDNAAKYYTEILALDPQNDVALKGIAKIADIYADLADEAYQTLTIPKAREYVRQGLMVDPHHQRLLELQKDLAKNVPGMMLKSIEKSFGTMFQENR